MTRQFLLHLIAFFLAINLSYAEKLYFPTTAEEIERALSTPSESFTGRLRGPGGRVGGNRRGPSGIVDDPPPKIASESKPVDNRNILAKTEKEAPSQPLKVGAMVHFDFDSARIRQESHGLLDEFVKALWSPSLSKVRMIVAGHTDSKGSVEYNRNLSQRRAQSVKDYLVKQGVLSARLIVRGFGETNPIASNATEEGRALNRRCEFIRADSG